MAKGSVICCLRYYNKAFSGHFNLIFNLSFSNNRIIKGRCSSLGCR